MTKNGDIRSVELFGSRTLFQGRPGVVGTALDTTEREKAEEALQKAKIAAEESRAQYEQVVSMISDIVWRYDVDLLGQFVASYISPVADRMLGLPDGTIGNSFDKFFSYVHPDDLPAVQKVLYDAISELAKEYVTDFRLRKADGTTIWVRAKGSVYSQPDGKITAFGTTSDITKSKKAEEAISESHKRLTDILDSIDSLVYVADFDSHELLFLNKYGREIWGEVKRRKCWQVFQKGQKGPCSFCTNDKLVSDSGISTGVCQWEFQNTVNGRWYECLDQAIPWTGETRVRMEIATDVTARKRAEEDLLKAKRVAEESRAQYEQVVSMISDVVWRHDVDNQGQYVKSYISPFADRMLGLPAGTIGNSFDKFFSYVHPDDLAAVQESLSEEIGTLAKDFVKDYRMRKADGTTIWVRARG